MMRLLMMLPVTLALLFPVTTQAAPTCFEKKRLTELLERQYKEVPVEEGLEAMGNLIRLYASPNYETWTLVVTTPKGVSCVMAVGEGWQTVSVPAGHGI